MKGRSARLKIPPFPFYWRVSSREAGSANIVEDRLPMTLTFDEKTQLVKQSCAPGLLKSLDRIYRADHNVGYLQDANTLARPYAADLLAYIEKILGRYGRKVASVAEIGCGGCVILERLKARSYDVVGIDPSPVAAEAGRRKGIPIIPEFFPFSSKARFDLIYHADVLEHMRDPVAFLRSTRGSMTERGLAIISVPDCSLSIETGDLSMCLHQHLSYFDVESLRRVVALAGFEVLEIAAAGYGGSLYCVARKRSGAATRIKRSGGGEKFLRYARKSRLATKKIVTYLSGLKNRDRSSLGFYVPLRAFPYLAFAAQWDVRLFDDTPMWHDKFFDGAPGRIEDMADLAADPVGHLLIMSLSFGPRIADKVRAALGPAAPTKIKTLRDLLA